MHRPPSPPAPFPLAGERSCRAARVVRVGVLAGTLLLMAAVVGCSRQPSPPPTGQAPEKSAPPAPEAASPAPAEAAPPPPQAAPAAPTTTAPPAPAAPAAAPPPEPGQVNPLRPAPRPKAAAKRALPPKLAVERDKALHHRVAPKAVARSPQGPESVLDEGISPAPPPAPKAAAVKEQPISKSAPEEGKIFYHRPEPEENKAADQELPYTVVKVYYATDRSPVDVSQWRQSLRGGWPLLTGCCAVLTAVLMLWRPQRRRSRRPRSGVDLACWPP